MLRYLPQGAAFSPVFFFFFILWAFLNQFGPDVIGNRDMQRIHSSHGNYNFQGNHIGLGKQINPGNLTNNDHQKSNRYHNIHSASKSSNIRNAHGGRNVLLEKLIDADERMTFEVRYGFIRLGNVYVYIKQDTVYRGRPAVHMVTEMIPNRRVPLVGNREVHYHNIMAVNDTIPFGLRFWQNSLHKDLMERYVYDFDYDNGFVYSFEEGEPIDTLVLDELADAGPATLFYARLFAGQNTRRSYPVYIDHEKANIEMEFATQQVSYDSPAFPNETISAFVMKGNADFNGPFGFSGEFAGFFKDDELRIPLEARVSIFIGNVRVRLIEYERKQKGSARID